MTWELVWKIYASIAVFSAAMSALYYLCERDSDLEYESVWDWIIDNLLWIKQPIKYLLKHLTKW